MSKHNVEDVDLGGLVVNGVIVSWDLLDQLAELNMKLLEGPSAVTSWLDQVPMPRYNNFQSFVQPIIRRCYP